MRRILSIKYLLIVLLATLSIGVFSIQPAHASGGYARLTTRWHYPDGSAAGVGSYVIHSENNYEVVTTTGYPQNYNDFQNAAGRSANSGTDVISYGSDLALNCQVSSGVPYQITDSQGYTYYVVGNTNSYELFYIDSASTPAGVGPGHWQYPPHFSVMNDNMTYEDIYWVNDAPPPPPPGVIQGFKVLGSSSGPGGGTDPAINTADVNIGGTDFTSNPFGISLNGGNYWFVAQQTYGNYKVDHLSYSVNGSGWTDIAGNQMILILSSGETIDMRAVYVPNNGVIEGYKYLSRTNNTDAGINGAPVLVDSGVNTSTSNPFYYSAVTPGYHYFLAPSPYNGYRVDYLRYSIDGGASWTDVPGNSMNIQITPGRVVDMRVMYSFDDVAYCTSSRVGNPIQVAAGSTFNFNLAYSNGGTHTWSSPDYRGALYFQSGRTDVPFAPGSVLDVASSPQYRYMNQFAVGAYGTAYFDTAASPSNPFTFTAPANPGTYWLNASMVRVGDEHFGAVCSYPIKVVRLYDYIPSISSSVGGSPSVPAASGAAVQPGQIITLYDTIHNRTITPNNIGDDYNWGIQAYSGQYNSGSPSVSFGSDVPIGSGFSTGVPANSAHSHAISYTVPANAVDGAQICFYASVNPAARTDANSIPPTVASRYSNFASGGTGADDNSNVRTNYSPGNITANDLCVEVQHVRTASVQAQQGDVHAGGNIGQDCTAPAAGTANITGNGGLSFAEYVTSASGFVTSFGSGNSGGHALTLSNNGGGNGQYGYICRPDLAAVADSYPGSLPLPVVGGAISTAALSGLASGLYYHTGSLTINGGVIGVGHRVTIFNKGDVTINSNITLSSTPANLANIPSFGLITGNGGNINISGNVTLLHGFYVAQNSTDTNGYIDTCYQHDPAGPTSPSHNTGDCPNTLTVLGSLTGHHLYFWRTGATGSNQGINIITENIRQSGILFLAPPPAFETQSNTPYALPQYNGETTPLY
jgi:hypothetical protein